MKSINGVKVYEVGEQDCFFAPTKEEVIKQANKMFGEGFVGPNGDIELDEVVEYSDEQFEKGNIIEFGDDGEPLKDKNDEYIKITLLQHLTELTNDGSKSGHFSTTEW